MVEPMGVDFFADDQTGHSTWKALGFQPDRPIRYSYTYTPSREGCDPIGADELATVSFRAEGDLDGDGVRSIFELRSILDATGLHEPDALHVYQRVE